MKHRRELMNLIEKNAEESYKAWLQYRKPEGNQSFISSIRFISCSRESAIMTAAADELKLALESLKGEEVKISGGREDADVLLCVYGDAALKKEVGSTKLLETMNDEGFFIRASKDKITVAGKTDKGVLYGVFRLLRHLQMEDSLQSLEIADEPVNQIRMINQWDNIDGSIERGYSGNSIFYKDGNLVEDIGRIKDYARLLSSTGINAISINNVNVWDKETNLITDAYLPAVKRAAEVFRAYGIRLFLSINYASPIALGGLDTADPLNEGVRNFWKEKAEQIYRYIPDFGGFIVKADSENRPGPFSYGRNHAEGANVLAEALAPFGGIVIWRCFVYNCHQDWRDRSTDRAKAAYDHFRPIDGQFHENVILQIKNGPMDFQVREPVSPLLGAMEKTNQMVEFQVAQEYTGQQKDVCFLVPQWKEVLEFDTHVKGEGSTIKDIASGKVHPYKYSGIAAVSNIGDDPNWTGNTLAQANLYGFGRLTWNPSLTAEEIAKEWIQQTFGSDSSVIETVASILLRSWEIYEKYTAPLGVGWMINPHHHYGPNIDGYEYSAWGTYHFADCKGIGVDRTVETGTGYTGQYHSPNRDIYNSLDSCPDELLLFFHHVPYTHHLHSGKTVIQQIYDDHFDGVEEVEDLISKWEGLEGKIDEWIFGNVKERFQLQLANAKEWRDQINTYFYRKSGIADEKGRTIY